MDFAGANQVLSGSFSFLVLVLFRQDFPAERTRNENDSTTTQFLMCAVIQLRSLKRHCTREAKREE